MRISAHYNLAVALDQHYHLYDEAKAHYLRVLELNPQLSGTPCVAATLHRISSRAAAHMNLALLVKNVERNYADAEALLRKAIETDPDNAKVQRAECNSVRMSHVAGSRQSGVAAASAVGPARGQCCTLSPRPLTLRQLCVGARQSR